MFIRYRYNGDNFKKLSVLRGKVSKDSLVNLLRNFLVIWFLLFKVVDLNGFCYDTYVVFVLQRKSCLLWLWGVAGCLVQKTEHIIVIKLKKWSDL